MAYRGSRLGLHEELVLLALEDRKGTFRWGSWSFVVGGAIVAELLLEKRIRLDEAQGRGRGKPDKNPLVELVDDEPLGCPVLDEALERIATAKRRSRLVDWITRFANRRGVQQAIARELCRRGILREDEASVLLFFKRAVFPEVNPVPERKLLDRLEGAVFADRELDARTAWLLVLAHAGRLLEIPFEKSRLKPRKKHLERIGGDDAAIAAMRASLQQIQQAMAAAAISVAT